MVRIAAAAAAAVRAVVKVVKGGLECGMVRFWGLDGGGIGDLEEMVVEEEEGERRAEGEKMVAMLGGGLLGLCFCLVYLYLVGRFPLIQ